MFKVATHQIETLTIHSFQAPMTGTRSGLVEVIVTIAPDDNTNCMAMVTCHHHEGCDSADFETWKEWERTEAANAQDEPTCATAPHMQLYAMERAGHFAAVTRQIQELVDQFNK